VFESSGAFVSRPSTSFRRDVDVEVHFPAFCDLHLAFPLKVAFGGLVSVILNTWTLYDPPGRPPFPYRPLASVRLHAEGERTSLPAPGRRKSAVPVGSLPAHPFQPGLGDEDERGPGGGSKSTAMSMDGAAA